MSNEIFTYNNLIHAVSGALGSVVGMVAFYPLDTIRCRLQLDDEMKSKNTFKLMIELANKEGVSTLYRGIVPVLQSICASNFVYFYVYNGLKASKLGQHMAGKDLLLATIAGSVNVILTTPLWMVNTRMKMSGVKQNGQYKNLLDGLVQVSKREGVLTLWNGTLPSLILVSNPAIYMAIYEALKRRMMSNSSALAFFLTSALAKMFATIITYPIQLIQTKLRHGHSYDGLWEKAGTLDLITYLLTSKGVKGFYKGMEAKLLQTVLTTALMFMTYEKIARFVLSIMSTRR